jgi:hypothetical protein
VSRTYRRQVLRTKPVEPKDRSDLDRIVSEIELDEGIDTLEEIEFYIPDGDDEEIFVLRGLI